MHPRSTDLDVRVGVAIVNRIDKHTGTATTGYGWIAEWIGRKPRNTPAPELLPSAEMVGYERKPGERSIQDSVARMKRNQLLAVTGGGGRGKANVYRPLIAGDPKRHGQPWGIAARNVTATRDVSEETARLAAQNITAERHKRHGQPCTLPKSLPNYFPNGVGGGGEGWATERALEWHSIKAGLERLIGPQLTTSWFGEVTLGPFADGELLIIVPRRFTRTKIEQTYMDELTAACRSEYPTLERVRLVAPLAEAAE